MKKSDEMESDLSSKNYLLDLKKNEKDGELNSLTNLLNEYKKRVL